MTAIADTLSRNRIGLIGTILGAMALLTVLVQAFAGPFAPQQRIGVTIGEIVVDIHQTVKRKLKGEPQPQPQLQSKAWDIDDWLIALASALGVVAILIGCVSLAMREQVQWGGASVGLGATFSVLPLALAVTSSLTGGSYSTPEYQPTNSSTTKR